MQKEVSLIVLLIWRKASNCLSWFLNSIPANTREVDVSGKTETKHLSLKTTQRYVACDDRDVLLFHQYCSEVCAFGKCIEHLDGLLECIEFMVKAHRKIEVDTIMTIEKTIIIIN